MRPAQVVRVRIEGRVQGVWFRAWTVETARQLGLGGWVRNRRDGSVEALFAGQPEAVEQMLRACHEGPPGAKVSKVERIDAAASELDGGIFSQRPTA